MKKIIMNLVIIFVSFLMVNEINEAQGQPPLKKPQRLFPVASILLLCGFSLSVVILVLAFECR